MHSLPPVLVNSLASIEQIRLCVLMKIISWNLSQIDFFPSDNAHKLADVALIDAIP
jgi:hypothetical protein